jgi:hypothetical protein
MNKKLITFLSILSLLLSTPLIPANAAVKAGGACSKAGITSVASGKTYTCIKSGKKLAWKQIQTSTASTSENYAWKSPCDKDPWVPAEWKEYETFALKFFNCSRPMRFQDAKMSNETPKSSLVATSDLNQTSMCKIPEIYVNNRQATNNNAGHRNSWKFSGDLDLQIIPVQFTDFNTTNTPTAEYGKYFNFIKEMFYKTSDGNTRLNLRIPDKYLQINSTLESFNTGGFLEKNNRFKWKKLDTPRLQSAIFSAADSVIDFSGVKLTIIVVPLKVPDNFIAHHPQFRMDNVSTTEGVVPANYIIPPANMNSSDDWYGVEPFLHLHEIFHATGMLSDHLGDWESGGNFYGTGNWGHMSGMLTDHLTWDKWLAGMLSDQQVICAKNNGTGTYWIKPATYFGQMEKLLVIPVSSTRVIAVESQRAAGMNFKLTKESQGALVYTVDVLDNRYDGGFEVIKPVSRSTGPKDGPFIFWDAPLKLKEEVTVWGYRISVVESGSIGDVIKVEKVS